MGRIKSKSSPAMVDSPDRWQLDSDVRSMARAHAIKKDPAHHAKVKAHAKTMMAESKRTRDEHAAIVSMGATK